MRKIQLILTSIITFLLVGAGQGVAHFGMLIPSHNIVSAKDKRVDLALSFAHPFEMEGMDLERPKRFFVVRDGSDSDLLGSLQKTEILGHRGWKATFPVNRPGVYQFVMEPHPYWEPAEDTLIIHYTKTIIAAFGSDSGWDTPVGLETEIVPLLRPFGNYSGNNFSGQVLIQGNPAAHVEVEVEMYNMDKSFTAPTDYHVTQVVKTDDDGVFNFTCPKKGWWGFAALSEAANHLENPEGGSSRVELGAVLWIYLDDYQDK